MLRKRIFLPIVSVLLAVVFMAMAFPAAPVSAENDTVEPGAIVDYGTIWGYADFLENVHRDTEHLFTGKYTVHGMDGKVNYTFNKEGYSTFTPKEPLDADGKDAKGRQQKGDWRMTGELEFDSSEYGFIVIRYRFSEGAHISDNHIYIRDDAHSGEFEGTQGMWTANALRADGNWNLRVLDLKKLFPAVSGTVKGIRIPIASRVGETFDIQYAAAFKTEEDALNFDYEAYRKSVNDSHEATDWEINEDGTINWIPISQPESSPPSPAESSASAGESSSDSGNGRTVIVICVCAVILLCAAVIIILICKKKKADR